MSYLADFCFLTRSCRILDLEFQNDDFLLYGKVHLICTVVAPRCMMGAVKDKNPGYISVIKHFVSSSPPDPLAMASTRLERFWVLFLRLVVKAFLSVFRLFAPQQLGSTEGHRLPPITEPLLRVSAVQLARNIRRKQVRHSLLMLYSNPDEENNIQII